MRKSILFLLALAAPALHAGDAWSRTVNFTATVSQVRAGCSKGGGSFEVHIDGGGYGCSKKNCDGKGGDCHVACSNKDNKCVGTTPGRIRAGADISKILNNGSLAVSPSGGAPTGPTNVLGSGGYGFEPQRPAAVGSPLATPASPSAPSIPTAGAPGTGAPATGGGLPRPLGSVAQPPLQNAPPSPPPPPQIR